MVSELFTGQRDRRIHSMYDVLPTDEVKELSRRIAEELEKKAKFYRLRQMPSHTTILSYVHDIYIVYYRNLQSDLSVRPASLRDDFQLLSENLNAALNLLDAKKPEVPKEFGDIPFAPDSHRFIGELWFELKSQRKLRLEKFDWITEFRDKLSVIAEAAKAAADRTYKKGPKEKTAVVYGCSRTVDFLLRIRPGRFRKSLLILRKSQLFKYPDASFVYMVMHTIDPKVTVAKVKAALEVLFKPPSGRGRRTKPGGDEVPSRLKEVARRRAHDPPAVRSGRQRRGSSEAAQGHGSGAAANSRDAARTDEVSGDNGLLLQAGTKPS